MIADSLIPFRLRLTVACLVLFGALSATAAPKPAPAAPTPVETGPVFYYNLDLDPYYAFTGTGELTEEMAVTANCYRLVRDADGRLTQITYRRAGAIMPDPTFGLGRIDFEYQPGLERRWFHNAHGDATKNADGVYGEELTLNSAGYATAVTNLDATGGHMHDSDGVVTYVRTLDAQNRLVSSRRLGLFGTAITDGSGHFERRWSYDTEGRVIELDNVDDHGDPLNDADGVAMIRTTYTLYPDSTLETESYFDASGIAAGERSSGVHQRQRTYDKRGFLTDESYYDSTGAPMTLSEPGGGDTRVHERKFTIDDRGNLVSVEFFDVNGRPVDERGPDIAKITYRYNEQNRVAEEAFFGDDGAPQINPEFGAADIRQDYDEHGTLVRQMFFDGQGHPAESAKYLAPAIRIVVDGDTTTVLLRNENDQPTKNPIHGYAGFSYKTLTDRPLSPTNTFYDRQGHTLSRLRVFIINPHLHALRENHAMKWSARLGAAGAGLGALLGAFLALRKASHTKRRKVYVPTPVERFLGWFSIFAILEGSLRFFMTIYWAWVEYKNGNMGLGFNVAETLFILFFLYRLYRLSVTMRVLNIEEPDIHKLMRDFFAKAELKAEWVASQHRYLSPPLDVRVRYFGQKYHAYISFTRRGPKGAKLAVDLASCLHAQASGILGPVRTRTIALYYPLVATCYFLLATTAFYTLYQLVKGYS
jgi:hypothetical protein